MASKFRTSKKSKIKLQIFLDSFFKNYLKLNTFTKILFSSKRTSLKRKRIHRKLNFHFRIKHLKNRQFFKRLTFAFINVSLHSNPQLIADMIAFEMAKAKKHKKLLNDIENLLTAVKPSELYSFKIVVHGKIDAKAKATSHAFQYLGRDLMPMQTFAKNVSYALGVSRTYTGLFGIKVWLYYP